MRDNLRDAASIVDRILDRWGYVDGPDTVRAEIRAALERPAAPSDDIVHAALAYRDAVNAEFFGRGTRTPTEQKEAESLVLARRVVLFAALTALPLPPASAGGEVERLRREFYEAARDAHRCAAVWDDASQKRCDKGLREQTDAAHRASLRAAEDFANATGRVAQENDLLRQALARMLAFGGQRDAWDASRYHEIVEWIRRGAMGPLPELPDAGSAYGKAVHATLEETRREIAAARALAQEGGSGG